MAAEVLDLDLLLSVSAGLGRWESDRAGRRVFRKDDDCMGEWNLFFSPSSDAPAVAVDRESGEKKTIANTQPP